MSICRLLDLRIQSPPISRCNNIWTSHRLRQLFDFKYIFNSVTIYAAMPFHFPLHISSSLTHNLIKLFHGFLKLTNGSINFAESAVGKDYSKFGECLQAWAIWFNLLNQYDIVIGSNLQFYDRASGENMGTKEHLGRPWIPIGNHNWTQTFDKRIQYTVGHPVNETIEKCQYVWLLGWTEKERWSGLLVC